MSPSSRTIGIAWAILSLVGCAAPDTPNDPPLVHGAARELTKPRRYSSPEKFIHEPRLAGCYRVEVVNSGGSFPYAWIPSVVELTTDASPRCCAPGSGRFTVGWSEDPRIQFLGAQWSEATNGNVHVSFGYGGILAFRLRRAGFGLVGSATNDSPSRGHDMVHPNISLTPTTCEGTKFVYEPSGPTL